MKAWYIEKPGSIDYLVYGEVEDITPGKGGLLVKVAAAGLNPVDYKMIESGSSKAGHVGQRGSAV